MSSVPPPTKEEIIAALQDAQSAFDQAVDDYVSAVENQTGIQAARLALWIAFRNLKRTETAAFIYQLGTLP